MSATIQDTNVTRSRDPLHLKATSSGSITGAVEACSKCGKESLIVQATNQISIISAQGIKFCPRSFLGNTNVLLKTFIISRK